MPGATIYGFREETVLKNKQNQSRKIQESIKPDYYKLQLVSVHFITTVYALQTLGRA